MSVFSIIVLILAAVCLLFLILASFNARTMIAPGRVHIWSDPQREQGLAFEDVQFSSQDGVPLKGWFIPGPGGGAASTVITVHGWPWCRMGTQQNNPLNDLPGGRPINLMPLIRAFHDAGHNVLMYDQSCFGDSGTRGIFTFGWLESRDFLGAIDFLCKRPDVDPDGIVAMGFSAGGSVLCYSLPQTDRIRAAISVQPTTPDVFGSRYQRDKFGPLAKPLGAMSELIYRIFGGLHLHYLQPALSVMGAKNTPILYVQGTGDPWGSVEDVKRIEAASPRGTGLYPETKHRFEGYTYLIEHPDIPVAFFAQHLAAPSSKVA